MTKKEILKIASKKGLRGISKLRKADLVRAIQSHEGNYPCYGTADGECDRTDCLWREDCLKN